MEAILGKLSPAVHQLTPPKLLPATLNIRLALIPSAPTPARDVLISLICICIYIWTVYMTVQQPTAQSQPQQPQSTHLVCPGVVPTGLMIDSIDEVGETKFTG